MRVLSSSAVRSNAGYEARFVEPSSAGLGMLQCTSSGCDGNVGHTSRTRSHSVITSSKRSETNSSRCLVRFALMSMPRVRSTRTAFGCSGFGSLPALRASIAPRRHLLDQRLGDLRPCAVAGAQEQHPSATTRTRRFVDRRARRRRGRAPDGAHRPRSGAPRGRRRGRSCSSCRDGPPSSGGPTPGRRRGAVAGGTTPGSAVRRPAPSAPTRPDHCAPAPAATANAPGATPVARTAADRQLGTSGHARRHTPTVPGRANRIKSD